MTSLTSHKPIHILELLKEKYGILVSDCEATTGWTALYGSHSIATASVVTTSPREDDFKELGSKVIRTTGSADSSGRFMLRFTPSSVVDMTGVGLDFRPDWLTKFSFWFKGTKAGFIKVIMTDATNRTSIWGNGTTTVAVTANAQGYKHVTLGSPTSQDSGFSFLTVTTIDIGYAGRTNTEGSMDFRVDGLRVQGDPTFELIYWATGPLDDIIKELDPDLVNSTYYVVGVDQPIVYPARRRGYSTQIADVPHILSIGKAPTTLRPRNLRIGYMLIPDPDSNRSRGTIKGLREYLWQELERILVHNEDAKVAQGLPHIYPPAHVADDDYDTGQPRIKGYLDFRIDEWKNIGQ